MNSKRHPLIFIVEDDNTFAVMIKKYLFMNGVRNIEIYNSGEECVKNLKKNPKIIIQDFDLPGMDGLEVLKKVKEVDKEVEFIFLSGQHSIKIAVEIMKSGASDYVIKDEVAKEYLEKKIKKLIYVFRLQTKQKLNKQAAWFFGSALVLSWLILGVFYFLNLT